MVEKDRSIIVKKTYLLKMLPPLYQTNLENQLSEAQFLFLNLLINVLQDIKEVSLEKIANALAIPIFFESRRKKIQRFLSLPILNIQSIWFPIIETWLNQKFSENQRIYLVIDRTKWQRNNLMMISLIYDQRAIPIYWEFLSRLGNSNFDEQSKIFSQVLPLFNKYQTVVLGDREFCSVKLANWLSQQKVQFCLRLKKSEFIQYKDGIWHSLDSLGLKAGVSLFLQNIKVTKSQKVPGFNIAAKWKRKLKGWSTKEGWFILTNLTDITSAINAYKKRFDIEEMFRDFKSGGYNLEDTNVSGNRLISLILIISFAYSMSTFQGQKIKRIGVQKYVARIKEYGRVTRRHSSFYVGLYSQTWVSFIDNCWCIVQKLMILHRNKLEYYLRGMRAMELILSTF
ncbi:transposase [Tolypothrix tenuis PCC 7101]|uniref:Transposase n=2 Tax=Tolypothrix TaxID=111782 RepID=A0A1Z4N8S2_9CYAN|nr:transposase [Tolypothrix tenuis PCC 7101]BAZ73987.1 transposase [Aulosira laxa NIES-50]